MENERGLPKRKYRRTPVDDLLIINEWQQLYKRYIKFYELSKTAALEKIASQYTTSRTTVAYWLFPEFRLARLKRKKGKTRHKKTPEYKLRDATIHHIHNSIEIYIHHVFEKSNYHPLSIDDIRYGIMDVLADDDKPKVLLRGTTLINLINKLENKTGKRILEKVNNTNEYIIS